MVGGSHGCPGDCMWHPAPGARSFGPMATQEHARSTLSPRLVCILSVELGSKDGPFGGRRHGGLPGGSWRICLATIHIVGATNHSHLKRENQDDTSFISSF